MGIHEILKHLPGGSSSDKRYSFYEEHTLFSQQTVPLDAAGALWTFAHDHASDYLRGNYKPALSKWTKLLNYLRSICKWKLKVFMDGRSNPHKSFENERRQQRADSSDNVRSQIRNTPEYIALAVKVCKFLQIDVVVSAYEADGQVMHYAIPNSLIAVTGDSDLLAIGSHRMPAPPKLVIVDSWNGQSFRVIDLQAPDTNGDLPLYDLYHKHGRIVFQLYAGCSGCDFTEHKYGIPNIGLATFVKLVKEIEDTPSAATLAHSIWREHQQKAMEAGLASESDVATYLQRIVDIYSLPHVYDEHSNIIDLSGRIVQRASQQLKQHMNGEVHTRTAEAFEQPFASELGSLDCSQLLLRSAAEVSTIRGVQLPANKPVDQNGVPVLRDFVAARGGSITLNKPELVKAVKCYQLLEDQVPRNYVDRNPDKNGSKFASINTSSTNSIRSILAELMNKLSAVTDLPGKKELIVETHGLFSANAFDANYDNIARVAPELKPDFIYKSFGHIGSSINEKNIGDAFSRCLYLEAPTYHAIALDHDSNTCIILCKAVASMIRDEKTRKKTPDGEPPKKKEYLLIMKLRYEPTDQITNMHNLGIFTELLETYCTGCVAGQGHCRHGPERLWYQYHHWTPERMGIERPQTLDACGWAPGGKALVSDIRAKLFEQQTRKVEKAVDDQIAKMDRGVKRNCTEGLSSSYSVYPCKKKQQPLPNRFSAERFAKLANLIRNQKGGDNSDDEPSDIGRPCRGEIRWYGATDVGLRDYRPDVHTWGMKDEIALHKQLSSTREHKDKSPTEISEMVLAKNMDLELRKDIYNKVHGREYDGTF